MKAIISITGKTCSGKSTLERKLVDELGYNKVISHTTRGPRDGEVDGKDYHFVTAEQFKYMLDNDKLVEHVFFNGSGYGVSVEEINKSDKPTVIVCEVEGVIQINNYCIMEKLHHYAIFVDIDPTLQATRFMNRDISNISTATKRLAAMLGIEQTWREAFYYDNYIEYNSDTEESILEDMRNRFG